MSTNDVRVAIYRSFVERGRPPMPAEVASDLDLPMSSVESAFDELAADDIIVLLPGTRHVWLAHPFSGPAAPFRVEAGDRSWDAICIWDALGILALLDADGMVTTRCPDCSETLELRVDGGAIVSDQEVAHYEVPAARWYEDIGYT